MANPALQVDADALRRLSDVLARHADTAASIDPTAPALTAAHALIATRLAAACERAGAGLRQAYRTLADRTRDMSVAALVNADDYDATDAAFGRLLKAYEAGMG